jgi:tetratricopeptide (TPR) repeat protein
MFFLYLINMSRCLSRKRKVFFFLFVFVVGLSGCIGNKTVVQHKVDTAEPTARTDASRQIGNETDYSCSYFYFLQGRHSELATKYNEALDAYEKALSCDQDADFIAHKTHLLLLRLNRGAEAVSRLRGHLEQHPEDKTSRMLLARIFIHQGAYQKAVEQYRKAHALHPKDTTPLLLLSELYLAENETDLAKDALRDVLVVDNHSYSAHLLLARLLVTEEKFEQGQRHYRQALDITWSEGLHLEKAEVFMRRKKYSKAAEMYRGLLKNDDLNEEARVSLIHVYLLQKKEKLAMAELNRLKELTKNPEKAELTIVRLYVRWEEYDKAVALLEKILQENELSEARYLLGILYFQKKLYEKALDDLQKINSDAKEYEDGLFLQVRTFRELKRYQEAVRLLESAVTEDKPRSAELYILLAGIYQFTEQEEHSRNTFIRALEVYPEEERLLYEYGLFLDYVGEQRQALKIMRRIIKMRPEHAGALNYVGYTWANNKENLNQAFYYISRAVELKPDNGYIHDSLGWVYYQQGKFTEAEKTLELAVELSPDDPAILDHLAAVYLAVGRSEDALNTWKKALELYSDYKEDRNDKGKKEKISEDLASRRIQEKINRLENKEKKEKK